MTAGEYLAKPDETLEEHIAKLNAFFEEFAARYAKYFSEQELKSIRFAINHHDDGKRNPHFQYKVRNNIYTVDGEIPHGILSCVFIDYVRLKKELGEDYAKTVLKAIYNHHNRIFPTDREVIDYIDDMLTPYLDGNFALYSDFSTGGLRGKGLLDENYWRFAVVKGMLNKMDYAASSNDGTYAQGMELEPEAVSENVQKRFYPNHCQQYMLENRHENIIVIASTGAGKTEGALLWAGNKKTFYTLPLKVSIDAIYTRLIKYDYATKEKLGHLHSDTVDFVLGDIKDDSSYENALIFQRKAKAYIYPMTISTVDQLFTFVFRYFGSEIITATLKYSRVVIDEIQSYSPGVLACILYGLKIITQLGGKFCIMTATLPPYLLSEFKKLDIPVTEPRHFLTDTVRHNIAVIEGKEFDFAEIRRRAETKRVLVIVNTVKRAQEVFEAITNNYTGEAILLHSRFIKNDRTSKEDKIKEYEKLPESCLVVSTQIVEASRNIVIQQFIIQQDYYSLCLR